MNKKYRKIHLAIMDQNPRAICEISQKEYLKLHEINQRLSTFQKSLRPFGIVEKNFDEIIKLLEAHNSNIGRTRGYSQPQLNEMYTDFNRVLLNYLSSVRFFQDFSAGLLKRWFGKFSSEVKEYNSVLSQNYDTYLEYRFLYGLRNYVQHYDLPVDALEFTVSIHSADNRPIRIFVAKESLLADREKWNKKLLSDIANFPDKIDFIPVLLKHQTLLKAIAGDFANILKTIRKDFKEEFERFMQPYRNLPGIPAIFKERNDDLTKMDYEYILLDVYRTMANGT